MEYVTVSGVTVPALGFGTARMDTYEERRTAINIALDTGYRHIDTAQVYGSEDAVGDAIAESELDRSDVFITTKLGPDNRNHEAVIDSTRESLRTLGMDYVDLLLIHAPNDRVSHAETLAAMNELRDDGLVQDLGVSNFSATQLLEAIDSSDAPILTNQVKYHVRYRQDDLLSTCIDEGVMLTAYSPLGVGDLVKDPKLATVGRRHGKTACQVALRWLVQQPLVSTIPMSSSPTHIRENFGVFDFSLSEAEMREVFEIGDEIHEVLLNTLGL